jgi:hypothetical protein
MTCLRAINGKSARVYQLFAPDQTRLRGLWSSRRGVLEQSIDWGLGPVRQGVGGLNRDQHERKGKKAGTVVLEAPAENLSLSIGLCTFVYEEPKEAKPVVRAEAESTTVSAPSVFFPSNEVFVFYELREPPGKESLPGSSRD